MIFVPAEVRAALEECRDTRRYDQRWIGSKRMRWAALCQDWATLHALLIDAHEQNLELLHRLEELDKTCAELQELLDLAVSAK